MTEWNDAIEAAALECAMFGAERKRAIKGADHD